MRISDTAVPVVVDDVKRLDGFSLTRCMYFSIEHQGLADAPTTLLEDGMNLPLLLLGFSGIVLGPPTEDFLFADAGAFDLLHEQIEERAGYFVDINEIWFPNFLFHEEGHRRGSIFRVGPALFRLAYDFQQETLSVEEYLGLATDHRDRLAYSPRETEALASWNWRQIDSIRKAFHADTTHHLQKKPDLKE